MAAQREWFEKDYYKVLGVTDDAAPKDITKAYRKLARELHPDKNPGDAAAEERFKEVSAAYDVLGDETKRKEYDEVRRLGPMGGGGWAAGPAAFTFNVGDMQGGGIGDLLGQMFGRARPWRPSGQWRRPAARRRRQRRAHARLRRRRARAHDDAAPHQRRPVLDVPRLGRQARHQPQGLLELRRARRRRRQPGHVLVLVAVPRVPGPRRRRSSSRARRAAGSGIERRPREVQARIPAGVSDGQTIRLKGRGSPGRNGGPAGDLLVEIKVTPHRMFGRSGNDLTVKVPITFAEAALGGDIDVPTLDGSAGHAADQAGNAERLSPPRARQGHRRRQEEWYHHGRPDRHRRGQRADEPDR